MSNDLNVFVIKYGFLVLLVGLIIFFSQFLQVDLQDKISSIHLSISSITGILALGVTCTLVVDGFDLSIGSVATSSLMMSAYFLLY